MKLQFHLGFTFYFICKEIWFTTQPSFTVGEKKLKSFKQQKLPYHRTIELEVICIGWKWSLEVSSPIKLLLKGISTIRSAQVTYDFIKSCTGNLQRWRWQNPLGNLFQWWASLMVKKFPLLTSLKLFNGTVKWKPVVSHPLVMQHCEEPVLDNLLIDLVRLLLGLPEATK